MHISSVSRDRLYNSDQRTCNPQPSSNLGLVVVVVVVVADDCV